MCIQRACNCSVVEHATSAGFTLAGAWCFMPRRSIDTTWLHVWGIKTKCTDDMYIKLGLLYPCRCRLWPCHQRHIKQKSSSCRRRTSAGEVGLFAPLHRSAGRMVHWLHGMPCAMCQAAGGGALQVSLGLTVASLGTAHAEPPTF
jgi:hypothetical protein